MRKITSRETGYLFLLGFFIVWFVRVSINFPGSSNVLQVLNFVLLIVQIILLIIGIKKIIQNNQSIQTISDIKKRANNNLANGITFLVFGIPLLILPIYFLANIRDLAFLVLAFISLPFGIVGLIITIIGIIKILRYRKYNRLEKLNNA